MTGLFLIPTAIAALLIFQCSTTPADPLPTPEPDTTTVPACYPDIKPPRPL